MPELCLFANGGCLSKHSAAVYSCQVPAAWQPLSSSVAQAKADTGIKVDETASGAATIETYAAIVSKGTPADSFVVARMAADGARVMARLGKGDGATLAALFEEEVIGRPITISLDGDTHQFAIAS